MANEYEWQSSKSPSGTGQDFFDYPAGANSMKVMSEVKTTTTTAEFHFDGQLPAVLFLLLLGAISGGLVALGTGWLLWH